MKRANLIAAACGLAALGLTTSANAGDIMAGMYGNTIVVSYPGGKVTKVYVKPGGAYTVIRDGMTINGTWADDGKQTCYTETDPAPSAGTKPVCVPTAAHKVGDTWTVKDAQGGTGNAVVVAGTQ